MATTVAGYLLSRLRDWGVEHVFAFPGDGINGILAAWRRTTSPRFRAGPARGDGRLRGGGLREVHRSEPDASAPVGVCMATSGPGAIHLLNGLYDAKLDHVPVVAIVGQTARSAMGGSYQQEVDLLTPVQGRRERLRPHGHRAGAVAQRARPGDPDRDGAAAPTAIIIPSDVQELEYTPPGHAFKQVPSSLGISWPELDAGRRRRPAGRRHPQRRLEGRPAGRSGRPRRTGGDRGGRRSARRRGGEGAARQGRAARRPAVGDRLHRPARHPPELRDDDGLRHAPDRRLELSVHALHAALDQARGIQIDIDARLSACATRTR